MKFIDVVRLSLFFVLLITGFVHQYLVAKKISYPIYDVFAHWVQILCFLVFIFVPVAHYFLKKMGVFK